MRHKEKWVIWQHSGLHPARREEGYQDSPGYHVRSTGQGAGHIDCTARIFTVDGASQSKSTKDVASTDRDQSVCQEQGAIKIQNNSNDMSEMILYSDMLISGTDEWDWKMTKAGGRGGGGGGGGGGVGEWVKMYFLGCSDIISTFGFSI